MTTKAERIGEVKSWGEVEIREGLVRIEFYKKGYLAPRGVSDLRRVEQLEQDIKNVERIVQAKIKLIEGEVEE